ncbi:MAG: hypothetical protein H7Y08_02790, partial [Rhizobiaceae bacterium]|nr:hypothetical protein [Rhizobiaceae bacterium]
GTALGGGVVTVAAGTGGALTLSTTTADALGISVSNVEIDVPEKTGGLTTAASASGTATTVASIGVGSYDATNGIAIGDTLNFVFTYDGVEYEASHRFTSVPADAAAFRTILETAVEAAVPVGGGAALGDGEIVVTNTVGALSFATVATGTAKTLALSSIGTVPKVLADHTGGLVAAVSVVSVAGLAQTISLASAVSTDPTKIRDGVTYTYNLDGVGGYTARLNELSDLLSTTMNFSATSDADTNADLADFAASSVSWLQDTRKAALSESEYKTTLLEETQKTLSNETGINMDEQLTKLIEIERSYQASSKLISTIDEMLETLLNSI